MLALVAAAVPTAAASADTAGPVVNAVWPRSGPVAGGTAITVSGSGFTGATGVTVAGVAAGAFTVVSDSVVQVTAPAAGGPATGPVVVVTPTGPSAAGARATFAYGAGASIMVPSYIYPGSAWSQIDAAGQPPVDLAIINPNSGPGSSVDANYAAQVATSQAAGVDVVGYVHTSYGSRSLATVEREISEYESWYHVDGIFVDEAATSCTLESSYYAPLYAYVHAQPGLDITILNPGESTNECYMAAADVVLAFEGSPSDLSHAGPLASWAAGYGANRFWAVVYGASGTTSMNSVLTTVATDYLARFEERTGIRSAWQSETIHRLPYRVEQELWRIVQEALANVDRHSGATQVLVRFDVDDHGARIEIADNGRGFDPAGVAGDHYGIVGMRERADAIGARLTISSRAERGTSVVVELEHAATPGRQVQSA